VQRVSPGGEYLQDRDPRYDTEAYTDQGFGENRGSSDWRTEDRVFGNSSVPREAPGISKRGKGPKGYRRSDARIREDVCDLLSDNPKVDATDIEVSVENGEVTLSGTVRSRDDKRRAEYVADAISGVRDVHNRLRIARDDESSGRPGDRTAAQIERH
jgi:osmotically-inducible protein OsmY